MEIQNQVYSALPLEMQTRIFEPAPSDSRKDVIVTNVIEVSWTIDGIYYVINPSFVKQKVTNSKACKNSCIKSFIVAPINQDTAKHRTDRAGTCTIECYDYIQNSLWR